MKNSIISYIKGIASNSFSKIKKVFKPEPERKLRLRSNGRVDFIKRKIEIKRLWINHNNNIKLPKTIFKYRRKRKKFGILRYKKRKPIKRIIQKHKPLPIEEPKALRTKKKRFVLRKTYIRLRRFDRIFDVFFYQAPFYKDIEQYLYKNYKRIVLDEAKRKRKILSELSKKLSTKDIDGIMELNLSNSASNVFTTVRSGYIMQRKRNPLIRALLRNRLKKKKKPMNTLLRLDSEDEKGFAKLLIKMIISHVLLKLTPAILGYPGSKKLTNYAREKTLYAAGVFLKISNVLFVRIVSSNSTIRAFRRSKVYRPVFKGFSGYVLSFRQVYRRAHGFIRYCKPKRL